MSGANYSEENVMFGGISVPVSELLAMAWHTGEEKYVAALEQYADEKGDEYAIMTAMHIRRAHHKPRSYGYPSATNDKPRVSKIDEEARQKFEALNLDKQKELLRKGMALLAKERNSQSKQLFSQKQYWISVYLVLSQRLHLNFTQKEFYDYALEITPEGFLENIRIGSSTMGNLSNYDLPSQPYYEWTGMQLKGNGHIARFHTVCERFWEIIKQLLYENS